MLWNSVCLRLRHHCVKTERFATVPHFDLNYTYIIQVTSASNKVVDNDLTSKQNLTMGIIKSIRKHIPETRGPLSSKKASDYCAMSLDSGETDAIFSQEESASDDVFFARLVERESPNADSVVASLEFVSPLKSPIRDEELFPILSSKNNVIGDDWEEIIADNAGTSSPEVTTTSKSLADDIESPVEESMPSEAIEEALPTMEQTSEVAAAAIVSPESESPVVERTTTPPTASSAPVIESPIDGTFGDVIDLATFTPTISNKTSISDEKLNTKENSLVRNLIQDFESGTASVNKTTSVPVAAGSKINVVTFGSNKERKVGSLVHLILCYVPDIDQCNDDIKNIFDFEMPNMELPKSVIDTSHQIREEFKEFCEDHSAMFASVCSSKNSKDQQPFEMLVFNKACRIDRVLHRLKRLDDNKKGEFSMGDGTKVPHFFVEDEEDICVMNAVPEETTEDDDDGQSVYSKGTASFKSLPDQKKPDFIEPETEDSKTDTPDYIQETVDGIKNEFNEFCDDHATLDQVQKGVAEFYDDQSVVFSVAATHVEAHASVTYDTLMESLFEVFESLNRFSEAFACGVASAKTNTENQIAAVWDTIESWDKVNTNTDGHIIQSFPQVAEA